MGLELGDDPRFHRRERAVRRLGVGLVVTVLMLALVGVAGGSGLVSTATAADPGRGVVVEYQRFVHRVADSTPQPARQVQTADAVVLRLLARPGVMLTVDISYRATNVGPVSSWVQAAGATTSFDQFVLP